MYKELLMQYQQNTHSSRVNETLNKTKLNLGLKKKTQIILKDGSHTT